MSSHGDCSVCTDLSTEENPIYSCICFATKVHIQCYGIQSEEENFKCNPCISNVAEPQCKLCSKKGGGAFKKTNCGGFVHVVCALWTEGVYFENVKTMEPVDVSSVPRSMRNKECSFCMEASGTCPHCSKYKCKNRIHILCAQKKNCLKEEKKPDDTIKFRAYCEDHKPGKTSRRISSVFVQKKTLAQNREAVKKAANKKKRDAEKSAALNSDWILKESNGSNHEANSQNEDDANENVDAATRVKIGRRRIGNHQTSIDSVDEQNFMEFTGQSKSRKRKQQTQDAKATGTVNPSGRKSTNKRLSIELLAGEGTLQWDSGDLRTSTTTENLRVDKENTLLPLIEYHLCYKDDKIAKVSVSFRFSMPHE